MPHLQHPAACSAGFMENTPAVVKADRILYTSSLFARTSLLYLQEVGQLKATAPHVSKRENLNSYLCFVVVSGSGQLTYEAESYKLYPGDVVFIDCRERYSHETADDLWALKWCHFYGVSAAAIYEKYRERGGKPVLHPKEIKPMLSVLDEIRHLAASQDHIRDMRINEKLGMLLTLLMEDSWHPEEKILPQKQVKFLEIKNYLDVHYAVKIKLEDLASIFFINKFYLSKGFKETYGVTVNTYLLSKRITHAKYLLRFSDKTIEEIGEAVGMNDANYFARTFRKVEGISPSEYRKLW